MISYWKISAFIFPLFMLQHIIRLVYLFGYHLHFYQHYPGPCHRLEGIDHGSSDFFTLPDGLTLVTSGTQLRIYSRDVLAHLKGQGWAGQVYVVDLSSRQSTPFPQALSIECDTLTGFNPHGVSAWTNPDTGEHIVYIVNHVQGGVDTIEKFSYQSGTTVLHHLQTYSSTLFRFLFGIQAMGEDSFYATNFLYERRSRFTMILELFALMPWSGVVAYDPEKGHREVIGGLTSATSLALSKCGNYLYVLSCLGSEVRVYKRKEELSLQLQQSNPLHTQPGSAVVDPVTGDLFLGSHPVLADMARHLSKPWAHAAPSQVLHLRLAQGNVTSVTELFYDDGTLLSGSSVAVVYNRSLLIGSLMDGPVLCSVDVPI